ncbi:MAG: GDP-mannose 4,6-dehydratase [Deltaproteobacteria bacterium]|nr:GDP-mannose 4,6-dehydratase [Deltaproteobacteria bacterium]
MRILLTGAAGFIGSHTGEALLARGDRVVGLDNFNAFYDPARKRANSALLARSERFELAPADLLDEPALDRLFAGEPFDAVVHLAAWAGVRPSIERPEVYADVNVRGTVNLLERARRHKVPRFVFASSSSVYGGRTAVPFRETDPVDHPISPYAATKKAGEVLGYTWHHLHGLHFTALRYFTVYGPRQRPEMAIHKFATMLSRAEPVPVYGDGGSARDYTYVSDIVQGTVAALDRCEGYKIYNLGGSRTVRLDTLVDKLARALGVPALTRQEPDQPGDVPITFADVSLARQDLGYEPRVTLDEGLQRFAEWFHLEGVK